MSAVPLDILAPEEGLHRMPTRRSPISEAKAVPVSQPDRGRARVLLEQDECGPFAFSGTADASYERQLVLDHVVGPRAIRRASAVRGRGLGLP